MRPEIRPSPILTPGLHWHPLTAVRAPRAVEPWLRDSGSLTHRLQQLGRFRVEPVRQSMQQPRADEALLLGLRSRQDALVREVLLYLDDTPVVWARSVLPLRSLRGGNQALAHLAGRSLGAELFRPPRAQRRAVWAARVPGHFLPPGAAATSAWGRQSLFLKRGRPLLVAEIFLPALWRPATDTVAGNYA